MEKVNLAMVNFSVTFEKDMPELFRKVVFGEIQMDRGDVNENMIRSTMTRVKYKNENFALVNAPSVIRRGDVCVESSLYGHYAGEVQIAKRDMMNSGMTNVVGHVRKEELFLLDALKPWQKFQITEE